MGVLTYSVKENIYIWEGTYREKDLPKKARFRWDPDNRRWWTKFDDSAAVLKKYADDKAKVFIEKHELKIEESQAVDSNVEIPTPEGLACMPFQKAGVAYALKRKNVLIGDEMGLGKTIQSLSYINCLEEIRSVLIVCPASLKLNWKNEAEKWLIRNMSIGIAKSKDIPSTDIVITNFASLYNTVMEEVKGEKQKVVRLKKGLDKEWDLLIVDECHRIKNYKANRTKAVLKIIAGKRIFLTGTPILNRPVELWTIAHNLAPDIFPSWKYYTKRYCNAYYNGYGWDYKGAANLSELQEKLRSSIMIRRLKKDVLTELPAKMRQVIEIPANGSIEVVKNEKEAWKRHQEVLEELRARVELAKASETDNDYEQAIKDLKDSTRAAFTEMAKLRHQTALAKIPFVIDHLNDIVDGGNKVVVFVHHRDVVKAIKDEFGAKAVILSGDTKMEDRQKAVEDFQNDKNINIFIGSITAAGVGITLTAASTVVFAELDWVPANITQAEDRLHRIGQKNSVLVQHLVLEGSLDAEIAQTIVSKQRIIDEALDDEIVRSVPVIPGDKSSTKKSQIDNLAKNLTDEDVKNTHTIVKYLASMCDGAREEDHSGYNKIDAKIGHSLAMQETITKKQAALGRIICKKYHRQIPEDLYNAVYSTV